MNHIEYADIINKANPYHWRAGITTEFSKMSIGELNKFAGIYRTRRPTNNEFRFKLKGKRLTRE